VDFLHGFAGILHGYQCFLVDVCGFDGVYLLFEHGYLAVRLLERVLVLLLSFQGIAGNYDGNAKPSQLSNKHHRSRNLRAVFLYVFLDVPKAGGRGYPPVLFVVTFSLAISSCFAI